MKGLLVVFLLVLMVLPTAVWSANLDFEGGFTNGVANEWTSYNWGWTGTPPAFSANNTTVHGGSWSQRVDVSDGNEGSIYRQLDTTPGKTYIIKAWAYVESGQAFYAVDPSGGGNPGAIPADAWMWANPGTSWQNFTWTGVAPGSQATVVLDHYFGVCYWDDVTIEEVSTEPVLPESNYYRIYNEVSELVGNGNLYYCGGVFDGKLWTGQLAQCAQLWGDEQVNVPVQTYDYWDGLAWVPAQTRDFSARVNMTQPWMPVGLWGPPQWGRPIAKCSIPVGGWIYIGGGGTGMFRTQSWWTGTSQTPITAVTTPAGELPESMCTDGEYIYSTTYNWTPPNNVNKIYKYIPNHDTGVLTNAPGWPVTVAGATGFSGISYYQGKIYAVDSGAPYGIYEIDATTGAATKLADFVYPNATGNDTQVVRYGNQLFITCAATGCHKLYTYVLSGGVWSASSSMVVKRDGDGDPLDAYGVAVKGDGTTARYAWVTAEGCAVYFYDLIPPFSGSPTKLGTTAWKNGYPVYVNDAVVTAIGTDGFWVESTDRAMGVHVIWNGTMPALNHLVTMKGRSSRTPSGEKTLTAFDVAEGIAVNPGLNPLFMTNKSMGIATGSFGLANDGMLVTICGKVTFYDWVTDACYIDDGSGVPSDALSSLPIKGVKVLKADGTAMSSVPNFADLVMSGMPCYATVTGVVRLEKAMDGTIIRRIDARSDADIVITGL